MVSTWLDFWVILILVVYLLNHLGSSSRSQKDHEIGFFEQMQLCICLAIILTFI
jgi:hypothetical protein